MGVERRWLGLAVVLVASVACGDIGDDLDEEEVSTTTAARKNGNGKGNGKGNGEEAHLELKGGPGAAWPNGRVEVWDYTPDETWQNVARPLLAEWEAIIGRDVKLVYVNKPTRDCNWVRKHHDYKKGQIAICEDDAGDALHPGASGERDWAARTTWTLDRHQIQRAFVRVDKWYHDAFPEERRQTMCHELGHALTGMGDRYDHYPEDSCVMGSLESPGPYDAKYARMVYRKHGGRARY